MGNHVVLIASDRLGEGPEELGRILIASFLKSLAATPENPAALLFINNGVRLTTEGSDNLETIREIEEQGADILTCGTCLDYHGLRDRLQIGEAGNMMETVDRLQRATSVIRI